MGSRPIILVSRDKSTLGLQMPLLARVCMGCELVGTREVEQAREVDSGGDWERGRTDPEVAKGVGPWLREEEELNTRLVRPWLREGEGEGMV